MFEQLTKTERLVVEVQHLALDLYDLTRTKGPGRDLPPAELDRSRRELADTLTTKLLAVGPLRNEYGAYFRALGTRLFEHLETEPAQRHCHALDGPVLHADYGWFYALSSAVPCAPEEYQQVLRATHPAVGPAVASLSPRVRAAEQKWRAAEEALVGEGLLPLSSARPSAVGGARFIADVWVSAYMLPGFRKALWEMGGFVEAQRPSLFNGMADHDVTWCTVSVREATDLFHLGKFMVLFHQADQAEEGMS